MREAEIQGRTTDRKGKRSKRERKGHERKEEAKRVRSKRDKKAKMASCAWWAVLRVCMSSHC